MERQTNTWKDRHWTKTCRDNDKNKDVERDKNMKTEKKTWRH